MIRTRVKICGLTTVADAQVALDCGADALGLVFYGKSPRNVTLEQAKAIARLAGPFVSVVGLFVNTAIETVEKIAQEVAIDVFQFHGDETEDYCKKFTKPYIKAVRMAPTTDPSQVVAQFSGAAGFLFDTWQQDKYGGTGKTFDWNRLSNTQHYPLILAGGLTPDNVAEAVKTVRPYAVDVSGGVELSPGVKSPELIKQFIRNAKYGETL